VFNVVFKDFCKASVNAVIYVCIVLFMLALVYILLSLRLCECHCVIRLRQTFRLHFDWNFTVRGDSSPLCRHFIFLINVVSGVNNFLYGYPSFEQHQFVKRLIC
jgi:predicted membrane-bound dolichyl-phosphate-mannose-protein mannosyltransferase